MRWLYGLLVAAALALAAAAALIGFIRLGKRTYELLPPAERGAPVALSLQAADGSSWSIETLRGRVLVVDVWASWCGPCVISLPELNQLQVELAPEGLQVIGLSVDEGGWETLHPFLAERPWLRYTVAVPRDGARLHDTLSYHPGLGAVAALPTTFLLDRRGRVAYKHVGAVTRDDLRPPLEKLLSEDR
ncbi:MAG TPA: TlpA disulfide reductase family protein [Acidobacteriota bacterium]|jgi:thiol-disulfide isomerase/thioredoxin